jgi:transposase
VQDWAEVQRLHRQGWPNIAIAEKLGMSGNTVTRLLGLRQPPRYERSRVPSLLDPFIYQIAAMLDQNAKVAATVVLQHVRDGYAGGSTILKDHLAKVRSAFLAAKAFQRTSIFPARSPSWTGGIPAPRSRRQGGDP